MDLLVSVIGLLLTVFLEWDRIKGRLRAITYRQTNESVEIEETVSNNGNVSSFLKSITSVFLGGFIVHLIGLIVMLVFGFYSRGNMSGIAMLIYVSSWVIGFLLGAKYLRFRSWAFILSFASTAGLFLLFTIGVLSK